MVLQCWRLPLPWLYHACCLQKKGCVSSNDFETPHQSNATESSFCCTVTLPAVGATADGVGEHLLLPRVLPRLLPTKPQDV